MGGDEAATDASVHSQLRIHRVMNGVPIVDPTRFDGMIQKLSGSLARRSLIGGSLGASVLAVIGLSEETVARKKARGGDKKTEVTAEACIATGKKCSSKKPRGRSGPNTKKPKRLTCKQCCQRRVIKSKTGKNLCYCATTGTACTETRECCDGTCDSGVCVSSNPTPPPVPRTCEAVTGVAMQDVPPGQANGSACTAGSAENCGSGYCTGTDNACQACPTPCLVAGVAVCCGRGDVATCRDANGNVSDVGECTQCCVSSGTDAPDGCTGPNPTGTNAACCTTTCSNSATAGNLGTCCTPGGENPTEFGGSPCSSILTTPNPSCCSGLCSAGGTDASSRCA